MVSRPDAAQRHRVSGSGTLCLRALLGHRLWLRLRCEVRNYMTPTPPIAAQSQADGPRHHLGRRRLWAVGVALCLFLLAGRMTTVVVQRLPPIADALDPEYNREYLLLHPRLPDAEGKRRVLLIGSSMVRMNLDEEWLAGGLSERGYTHVDNLGSNACYGLSMVVLANQLKPLEPDLVIWGMDVSVFRQLLQEDGEFWKPWEMVMVQTLGGRALYDHIPALQGRPRVLSQAWLLDYLKLYRYREYLCSYLKAWLCSRLAGQPLTLGKHHSERAKPNPRRMAAVLKQGHTKARPLPLFPPGNGYDYSALIRDDITAVAKLVRQAHAQLVVAWLPRPLDTGSPEPLELTIARRSCQDLAVPFVNLRGTVPVEGFLDSIHANRDGKLQITRQLASRLRPLLVTSAKTTR